MLRKALTTRNYIARVYQSLSWKQSHCIRHMCNAPGTTSPPEAPEHVDDKEGAGKDLAKLAKITAILRDAIEKTARDRQSPPEILIALEEDVNKATELINTALQKAAISCTMEQLADRINNNVVKIPRSALDYKQFMTANLLRDSMEETLVSLQVEPPQEVTLDGHGRPFSRLDRKALRKKQLSEQEKQLEEVSVEEQVPTALTELRPVTHSVLAMRKAHMERATAIDQVLRGYETALLGVSRVHKVTKGGTTFGMRALVVIGNRNGTAGYGEGKSDTAQHAIERACRDAKRNLLHMDLHQGRTIFHRVKGSYVKSNVTMWPAPRGTGISANNNFSAVLQLFGFKDVGAKLHGPRCLSNSVKALFNALSNVQSPESVAMSRGLKEIIRPPLLELGKGAKRRKVKTL